MLFRSLYQVHRLGDISFRGPKLRICGIGTKSVAITTSGEACLCQYDLGCPIGDGLKDNVLQLLKSQVRFSAADNRIDHIPDCQECQWRFTCAAGCPMLTKNHYGGFRHPSPYCEVYKAILPVLLRLHAIQLARTAGVSHATQGFDPADLVTQQSAGTCLGGKAEVELTEVVGSLRVQ